MNDQTDVCQTTVLKKTTIPLTDPMEWCHFVTVPATSHAKKWSSITVCTFIHTILPTYATNPLIWWSLPV
jgi:hypothetical protein